MSFDINSFNKAFDIIDTIVYGVSNVSHMIYSLISSLPPIFAIAIFFGIYVVCICAIIRAITF